MAKKYLLEVDDDLWKGFKIVASLRGLKVKEAVNEAITEYVKGHQGDQVKIDVQIIESNKKNLLTFVYEEQIRTLLSSLIEAKKRKAPLQYISGLKKETLETLKKHPAIPEDLANEIVRVFKNMT